MPQGAGLSFYTLVQVFVTKAVRANDDADCPSKLEQTESDLPGVLINGGLCS